eukprot:6473301-Pyramimonas_sp.AAC.1
MSTCCPTFNFASSRAGRVLWWSARRRRSFAACSTILVTAISESRLTASQRTATRKSIITFRLCRAVEGGEVSGSPAVQGLVRRTPIGVHQGIVCECDGRQ